jgi:hypothetical protein
MEKMMYNRLAVAIAVATSIMLATSGSAASVLAQRYSAPTTAPPQSTNANQSAFSHNPDGSLKTDSVKFTAKVT